MTTLTIEIPDKGEKKLTEFVKELGGKIVTIDSEKKKSSAAKKKQILDDLEESVAFIKLHQEGKIEARTIQELLNEL